MMFGDVKKSGDTKWAGSKVKFSHLLVEKLNGYQ